MTRMADSRDAARSPRQARAAQPWGVVGDGDFMWVADSAGRRALKFASNARYLDELGKAGLIHFP